MMSDDAARIEIHEPEHIDRATAVYMRECAHQLMLDEGVDHEIVERIIAKLTISDGDVPRAA